MNTTHHLTVRQNQRGITSSMVAYVIENGIYKNDKLILSRKDALKRLAEAREEVRLLMKIIDKKGLVLVVEGDTAITTYNLRPQIH